MSICLVLLFVGRCDVMMKTGIKRITDSVVCGGGGIGCGIGGGVGGGGGGCDSCNGDCGDDGCGGCSCGCD